jgi:O-antigen ligase
VYGPYVNHAHYAGLMEMLLPFALVFAISNYWHKPIRVLFSLATLVMGCSLFLSQSLGGIIAFVAELLVLALVLTNNASRKRLPVLGTVCLLLIISVALLHPKGLGDRLLEMRNPLSTSNVLNRLLVTKDSLKMVARRPGLGWGLGTFTDVYPSFRSFYSDFVVNEAHNDFMQTLVETGVAGFSLLLAFLVLLYRNGVRNCLNWRHEPRAGMALAALLGCTGVLVHGFSNFNLHIPANAAMFFVLAAMASTARRTNGMHRA